MKKQAITFIYSFEDASQDGGLNNRLDLFLSAKTGLTRSFVQKNIKNGFICVNLQVITKTGFNLHHGDNITGFLSVPEAEMKAENIPLKIVFEDEHLAVINKPSGLIVHPTTYLREGTLVNALIYHYKNQLSTNLDEFRPGIVHRLDKDTSGLMVIAKTNKAHLGLAEQLKSRTLKRIYWAIAIGSFKELKGCIEAPIGRHPIERKKMTVILNEQKKARYARTFWEIIENFNKAALVKISLDTGRTHQIRVHFEYINHPLLGDPLYGGGKRTQSNWIQRQALHAKEIQFLHPMTQENLFFTSELPNDFEFTLNKLRAISL